MPARARPLRELGDPDPSSGAPRDRGLRLAGPLRRERTLLVFTARETIAISPTSRPDLEAPSPVPKGGKVKEESAG